MQTDSPVLLYDGTCKLCSATVDFVLRHERQDDVKFMWLQDERAQALIQSHGIEADTDSLIFIENSIAYLRSDGALRLSRYLNTPWSWTWGLRWVPRALRDAVYRLVARYRKQIMGSTTCALPIGKENRYL